MYRKHLSKKMPQDQFLTRVGSLPVIISALDQMNVFYGRTKESNRLMKYTLESAESGVKTIATRAQPVVGRLDGQIVLLNSFACNQLDKLEEKYPIITQPTDTVLEESKQVYEKTLKPTVDRVTSVIDVCKNTTEYGINKYQGVKNYGTEKVSMVTNYSLEKVSNVKDYGVQTVSAVLEAPYVQTVSGVVGTTVDSVLNTTECYVDYYLPPTQEQEDVVVEGEEPFADQSMEEAKPQPASNRLVRATSLTSKVRHRVFRRAMSDLGSVQKRSWDTVNRLNFTVDLIQYAKDNIDNVTSNVKSKYNTVRDKVVNTWDEINKSENEVVAQETDDQQIAEKKQKTLETRLIATARHLTLKLKRGLDNISNLKSALPENILARLTETKKYSEEVYTSFASATKLEDLPQRALDNVRFSLEYIRDTVTAATTYVSPSTFMGLIVSRKPEDKSASKETRDASDASSG